MTISRFHPRPFTQGHVPICIALGPTCTGVRPRGSAQQKHLRHLPSIRHRPAHARVEGFNPRSYRWSTAPDSQSRIPHTAQVVWLRLDRMHRTTTRRTGQREKGSHPQWTSTERAYSPLGCRIEAWRSSAGRVLGKGLLPRLDTPCDFDSSRSARSTRR